jgi:membrane associated rhomboid family serine protease
VVEDQDTLRFGDVGDALRINSLLIMTCIVASFWAWQQDPKFAEQNLVFSFNNLMQGRYWTLLTALFIHGSILHLFGNMLFLFVFGGTLQNNIGSGRYLMVFLTGGLTGFVLSLPFVAPDAGMLGASAAIFAVAACVMLVRPLKFSWLLLAPQGLVAILYFLYNVLVVYDPRLIPGYDPQVGYIAHIIGFVTGIPFGIAWSNNWKKNLLITLLLFGFYVAILTLVAGALQR